MNMDYCKFENTLDALRQCMEHLRMSDKDFEAEYSRNEVRARQELSWLILELANEIDK